MKPTHQRVTIGQPVPFVACGVNIKRVKSSMICAVVTCPKCLEFQKALSLHVLKPLR